MIFHYEKIFFVADLSIPISWDGFKQFSLAEIKLPSDRVVTGLKFDTNFQTHDPNMKRIGLTTFSTRFNFTSGELFKGEEKQHLSESGR